MNYGAHNPIIFVLYEKCFETTVFHMKIANNLLTRVT